jgi:hypothetical protein
LKNHELWAKERSKEEKGGGKVEEWGGGKIRIQQGEDQSWNCFVAGMRELLQVG